MLTYHNREVCDWLDVHAHVGADAEYRRSRLETTAIQVERDPRDQAESSPEEHGPAASGVDGGVAAAGTVGAAAAAIGTERRIAAAEGIGGWIA